MRLSIVLTIFRKELTETLRDRRTLTMMLGLPILLYPLMIIGFSKLQESQSEAQEERSSRVAVWGELPADLRATVEGASGLTFVPWSGAPEAVRRELEAGQLEPPTIPQATAPTGSRRRDLAAASEPENELLQAARAAIATREIDAVLVGFADLHASLADGGLGRVRVYFDSVREESLKARERLVAVLGDYRRALLRQREQRHRLADGFATGLDVGSTNVARQSRRAGQLLGTMLPFMLIVVSLLGGFYPAIDMTAGEKERGTMQTLLCAPVRSGEIIFGKFLAVWIIGLIAAAANVASLAATLTRLLPGQLTLPASSYALTFVLLLPVTLLFTAIFLAVAVFAKDFKDGQNFLTPVYMTLGLPAAVTMLPGQELSAWTAFVPVVNIALLVKAVLMGEAATDLVFLTLLSSAVYAGLAMMLAARMFEREQILLGGRESWRAVFSVERRPGSVPTAGLAVTMFAVVMVVAFYGSLFLERYGVVPALLVVEFAFFLAPVVVAVALFGFDWRRTFSIARPQPLHVAGAVLIGLTAWTVAGGLFIRLLPPPESLTRALEKLLLLDGQPAPLWVIWLAIGLTPAVCEELFFRGFVLTGLRRIGAWPAILISGLLFGLAHASIYRLLPTLFLGVLFGVVVWRTGSIVCSIVAHALNNGLMATIVHSKPLANWLGISNSEFLRWDFTIAGTVLTAIGVALIWRSPHHPRK